MSQTSVRNQRSTISRSLRTELRRTFSVWAFGKIHTQGGMHKKDQEKMMYDLYHGNEMYPSHIEKILKGESPYQGLYRNDSVTENEADVVSGIVLKDEFTIKESVRHVKPKVHLTKEVLECASFSGPAFVTGRALLELAKTSMKTIRKTISVLLPKVDDEMRPILSGRNMDDVWNEVLDEMYTLLNGKTSVPEDSPASQSQDDPTPEKSSGRPEMWRPDGWMAIHLFGPTAPASNRLNLMEVGDPDNGKDGKKKRGRAAARKEQQVEKKKARENDTSDERGLTIGHRIGIAGLILNRKTLETDVREQSYMSGHFHANRLIDSISQQIKIVELFPLGSEERNKAVQTVLRLQEERDSYNEKLREELEKSTQVIQDNQVSASNHLPGVDDVINILSPPKKKQKIAPVAKAANKNQVEEGSDDDSVYMYPTSSYDSPNM